MLISILGLMSSCRDDFSYFNPELPNGSLEDGVRMTLRFPDMGTTATRSMESPKTLDQMDLYLFVFDGGNLLQTLHIEPGETTVEDGDGHDTTPKHVSFTATLPQTDYDAVVHIVALDDTDGSFAQKIETLGYGLEDIIMPSLSVGGTKDAYWQRVDLHCAIRQTVTSDQKDGDGNPIIYQGTEAQVLAAFENPIPLIRNFAKIELDASAAKNFVLTGWTLVNDLDGGSVVPYYSLENSADVLYPKFAEWSSNPASITQYDGLISQAYHGVSLPGAGLRADIDMIEQDKSWETQTGARYLYEKKYSVLDPLYIILKGDCYSENDTGHTGQHVTRYYKLLVCERDEETGIVTDYDILRNIIYTVKIRSVNPAAGYNSATEAASAPASNNLSGDVVTKDMFSITDAIDMLYVNQLNFIITKPNDKIDFRYRYMTGLQPGQTLEQKDKKVEYDFYKNDSDPALRQRIGLPKYGDGVVIDHWEKQIDPKVDEVNPSIKWSQIFIYPKDPTDELRQESFYVFSKPEGSADGTLGLSRKINIILRNPWDFVRVGVYPGSINNDTQFPDFDPDTDKDNNPYIGGEKGAPLTLFFELPAGLPEAMFPLDFKLESNKQNIENAASGNAVVNMGESLFADEGVKENRISYIKTVTWRDYAPDGEKSTAASRIVRMRLVTTTNISSLSDDAIVSQLRLQNDYFNMGKTSFTRDPNVIPSYPDITEVWNLSSPEWLSTINQLASGATNTGLTFGSILGLSFYSGDYNNANVYGNLKSGDDNGEKYIQIYRYSAEARNCPMILTKTYPQTNAPKKARLTVTASNSTNSGTPGVGLTVSVSGGTDLTPSTLGTYTTKSDQSCTINIPAAPTTVSFTIYPSANNTGVRIYGVKLEPIE